MVYPVMSYSISLAGHTQCLFLCDCFALNRTIFRIEAAELYFLPGFNDIFIIPLRMLWLNGSIELNEAVSVARLTAGRSRVCSLRLEESAYSHFVF